MFKATDCLHNMVDIYSDVPFDAQICFTCVEEYALKSSIEDGEDYEYYLEQLIDSICCEDKLGY